MKLNRIFTGLSLVLISTSAFAAAGDAVSVIENVGKLPAAIAALVLGIAGLTGIVFLVLGIMDIVGRNNPGSQVTWGQIGGKMIAGVLLVCLLPLAGSFASQFFGDTAGSDKTMIDLGIE